MPSKSSVTLSIVDENFKCYEGKRIQQGEFYAGPEKLSTLLRSCVCIGFYHPEKKIGAISHITGFRQTGGHHAEGALKGIARQLKQHALRLEDCQCFLIGGADSSTHVYQAAIKALSAHQLSYAVLDVLGTFHRKLLLDPASGAITLYKKEGASPKEKVDATFAADPEGRCFDDPGKRLLTGASLMFRNRHLLHKIENPILPELSQHCSRLHIWCAGCSIGMEVYSVAMVVLNWMSKMHCATQVRILGSDISEDALFKARQGEYPIGVQNFKEHAELLDRYTTRSQDSRITMGDELRRIVSFKERDIRVGSRKHLFELVICDHVLQYFSEADQRIFIDSLTRAVQPKGYLFASSPSSMALEYIETKHHFKRIARHLYQRP